MIEFQVLGSLGLRGPGGEEIPSVLSQPKRTAILAYLAVASPRGFHRRDTITGLFWPEVDQEHARASLRKAVHHLRRALGESLVLNRGDEEIGLDWGQFSCDAIRFQDALDEEDRESALEIYRGDFLEGFFLSGCPDLERWMDGERTRLREMAAGAAWELAHQYLAAGRIIDGERMGQRALSHLCTDESEARRFIEALAEAGDRAAAVRFFERFGQVLWEALELKPSQETNALVESIRRSPSPGLSPLGTTPSAPGLSDPAYAEHLKHGRLPAHGEARLADVQGIKARALSEVPGPAPAPARRRFKASGRLWVTLLAVVGTVAFVAVWPFRSDTSEFQAPPGIAVLPFSVQGEGLELWREGMVNLLSTNMNGVGGLRTIDCRTVLARWSEQVPESGEADRQTALEIAQATGARYALLGSAVAIGPEVRLSADIHDTEGGARMGGVQVEGSPDDVLMLVDRLAVQSLAVVLGQEVSDLRPVDLASVTTASIPALTAWLEAEALFRRGDFEAAVPAYQRAVVADSTFALAFYGLGNAYGWTEGDHVDRTREAVEEAMRRVDRLPLRKAALVRAVYAWQHSAFQEAEDLLKGLVRSYPDYAEAWFVLGDLYYHAGLWIPAGVEEAQRCFARAVELDPGFTPYRVHTIDLAFAINPDSAQAARLLEDYKRLTGTGAIHTRRLDLGFDLAFGDQVHRDRALASLDTVDLRVLRSLHGAPPLFHPRFWPQLEAVYLAQVARGLALPGRISLLFHGAALGRGYLGKALEYLDWPQATTSDRVCRPVYAYIDGLPVPADRLEEAASALIQIDSTSNPSLLYCGAFLSAEQGRWAEHARAVEFAWDYWRREVDAGRSGWQGKANILALEAYGLLRQGDPEAAVEKLEEVRRYQASPRVRTVLGYALMELERWEEAIPYLAEWSSTNSYLHYHLARAYEGMGEHGKAAKEYTFFVEAWKDADPELQPWVEDARRALERLAIDG
ncbi:MAG: BTAD domain-containing putative transcriptional regulator [Gemmatimonadota bacterium]|jgi:serine/threonine-protein kinase